MGIGQHDRGDAGKFAAVAAQQLPATAGQGAQCVHRSVQAQVNAGRVQPGPDQGGYVDPAALRVELGIGAVGQGLGMGLDELGGQALAVQQGLHLSQVQRGFAAPQAGNSAWDTARDIANQQARRQVAGQVQRRCAQPAGVDAGALRARRGRGCSCSEALLRQTHHAQAFPFATVQGAGDSTSPTLQQCIQLHNMNALNVL